MTDVGRESTLSDRVQRFLRDTATSVATTEEIATSLECQSSRVDEALESLSERGRVDSRQIAGVRYWWATNRQRVETDGRHDPTDPFFASDPIDAGETIDVADTDELLGDVLRED